MEKSPISRKYKKYKAPEIPEGSMTMDEICSQREFVRQLPQKFVAKYLGPKTNKRGVLLFHGLGSGKTCASIGIVEENLAKHKKKKALIILSASLESNFIGELLSSCTGATYVSSKERSSLAKDPESEKSKKIIASAKKAISKRYDIISYQKFHLDSKKGMINLSKYCIVVIDEVQNILGKLWYESLMRELKNGPEDLKIVLMSATPIFDDEIEIAKTLNILKFRDDPFDIASFKQRYLSYKPGTRKIVTGNMDEFKERIKGLVSYVRGANPAAYPEVDGPRTKICKMSEFQTKVYYKYKTAPKELRKKNFEYNNSIYKAERQASELVYPNGSIGSEGQKSETKEMWKMPTLRKYSCKFAELLNYLEKNKSLAFVYSNFVNYGGAASVAKALEANGYVLYGTKSKKPKYAIFTGDETKEQRDKYVKAFNKPSNSDGSVIRVMVGSMSISEGVTLKRVRQVHILNPFFNKSTIDQAIGRAVRFCSHKDLPLEERKVDVFLYRARAADKSLLIDDKIYDEIVEPKNRVAVGFLTALKEVAVDCNLFKNLNEKDIRCHVPDPKWKYAGEFQFGKKERVTVPKLMYKKGETEIKASVAKKKEFIEKLKDGNFIGVRVSWISGEETEKLAKQRAKKIKNSLERRDMGELKVEIREMATASLTALRPEKKDDDGEGGRGKSIPKGKNKYSGCPAHRRPILDDEGKEDCGEGREIGKMKSGSKCCYVKGKRRRATTSSATKSRKEVELSVRVKENGEVYIGRKKCINHTIAELQALAKQVGISSEGRKDKICARLEQWVIKTKK